MRVTLSDTVLDPLVAEAERTKRTLEEVIEAQLARLRDYPTTARVLVLGTEALGALEDRLGVGATRSVASLIAAVDRLAQIEVGRIRLPLSPNQLEELKGRADKRGISLQVMLREHAAALQDGLFNQIGG